MFDKLQVKFYRWLARHTPGLSAYLSDDAKRCWFAAGIAYATRKPVEATWEQYPRMLFQALNAFDAFERAGQERAIDLAQESPRETDPMKLPRYVERIRTQHELPKVPLGARQRAEQRKASQ